VRVESQNTGKPLQLTADEELPPAIDQIRFFAGAARVLEGRATGEYMKDHTSSIRASRSAWSARSRPGTTR
jgi:betaine-aldehyde dehydrogenase